MTKVLIAIPCLDSVPSDFAMSLAAMLSTRAYDAKLRKSAEIALQSCKGTIIPHSRRSLVQSALDCRASHILFLDSDMTFPPDTLDRLLYHHKPIVAGSYIQRYPPHKLLGTIDGPPRPLNTLGHTLLPMLTIPLGCALIRTDIFPTLPKPWFTYTFGETPQTDISEDVGFCNSLRAAGHTILLDPTLTTQLGHIGVKTFRPGDTQ